MKRLASSKEADLTFDQDLSQVFTYSFFWKEFGFNKKGVDSLDPKIVRKIDIYYKVKKDLIE